MAVLKILIVGSGKGSWEMRGQQLGAALGARVTTTPTRDDWAWAELAILVKKHGAKWAQTATLAGVPVVWDALDCWRQPHDNQATPEAARALLVAQIAAIHP